MQTLSIAEEDLADDEAGDVDLEAAPGKKKDHGAVRLLFSNRIGLLVGKIEDLQQELERTQATAASDLQEAQESNTQLQQQMEEQAAAKPVGEAETKLAQSIMAAVHGDEE